MRKLKLEYSHLWWWTRTMELDVPERWEDMNERQFAIGASLYQQPLGDVDFISLFFGIKKRLVKRFSKFEQYKLTQLIDFVLKPTGVVNFFYMETIPGTKLLSPGRRLKGVSFEQFGLFDTYFFDYANHPTHENLCTFVAALYLKKGEVITEIDFEKRVKYIESKVDKLTLYAVFLNYVFLRDWLSKAYVFLFEKNEPADEPETKKPVKPARPDWNSILDGLVGEDILHSEDYKLIPCIQAFKTINKRIKEYNRNAKH